MNTKEEMKEVECDREKGQGRCKKEKLQVSSSGEREHVHDGWHTKS